MSSIVIEIGTRLIERLDFIRIQPSVIIALGLLEPSLTKTLEKRYATSVIENISLPNNSIDFIFANLLLPRQYSFPEIWQECSRLLKPEGCLLFSTFGPDVASDFMDMHNIGDDLLRAKLTDPVVDREEVILEGVTLEVIYGLAWGARPSLALEGEVAIPLAAIKRSKKYSQSHK